MQDLEDKLTDKLDHFLKANGINPVYFAAAVTIVAFLSYYKELKNWKNVERSRKWLIVSILSGAVVSLFGCIILLL